MRKRNKIVNALAQTTRVIEALTKIEIIITYDQFLQNIAHAPSSSLVSLSVILPSLSLLPLSLLLLPLLSISKSMWSYRDTLYLYTAGRKTAQKTLETCVSTVCFDLRSTPIGPGGLKWEGGL